MKEEVMFTLFWSWLEPETKQTIRVIAPILVLIFVALLHIHPLVTIMCLLLMGIYGVCFFIVRLSRQRTDKVKKHSIVNHTHEKI